MGSKSMDTDGIVVPQKQHLTYGKYLHVPELLQLQKPLAQPEEHDEMLFIIIHQAYELWFKQILHETQHAVTSLQQDDLWGFTKTVKRVLTILNVLVQQVSILETMTPSDFNRFRDRLNPASGFQSHQFRLFEFRMGMKDPALVQFFVAQPEAKQQLEKALAQPSLYDEFLAYLSRKGLGISPATLQVKAKEHFMTVNTELKDLFLQIYREPRRHFDLYVTLETLVDLDQIVNLWRMRHVSMVERLIGGRRGTGGSPGVKYLQQTLAKRCFPELWDLRSELGSDGSTYGESSPDSTR